MSETKTEVDVSPMNGLHPQPGEKDGETLRAEPDPVRNRDWPQAGYTPEDVFLTELAKEEAAELERASAARDAADADRTEKKSEGI